MHGDFTTPTFGESEILCLGTFGLLGSVTQEFPYSSCPADYSKAAAGCDAYPHMCN